MTSRLGGVSFAITLGAALIGLCLVGQPASADNKDKNWNRGCADAKAGTYDRTKHGDAYEKGWQACKSQAQKQVAGPSKEDDDYARGCDDAKAGSYDRANPTPAYERGWQSCKQTDHAGDEARAGKQRQADWDRGCADSKAKSYDRANHNADYEAGWQACKTN